MNKSYKPEIRFADIDAMGHVNNAVYFSYFEQARIFIFKQLVGDKWNWDEDGLLVAHNEIDYKLPIFLNDKIEIETSCTQIGNKSFTLKYMVLRNEEICATGTSVLVCFHHKKQQSQLVPPLWKEKLLGLVKE